MRYNTENIFLSYGTRQGHIFTCELLRLFGKMLTNQHVTTETLIISR